MTTSGGRMRGIREIAIIALESGQIREAETMLRQLLVAQLEELGSLNEETANTCVVGVFLQCRVRVD